MRVKIICAESDARGIETILKEWCVTTESQKRLTASRARKILRSEVEDLNLWHSKDMPILIKMGDGWRAMRSTGTPHVWNYYYIEEVLSESA